MSERYIASQHAEFVDALRACLGLQPLYSASKPTAEWWHGALMYDLKRGDGQTRKKTAI